MLKTYVDEYRLHLTVKYFCHVGVFYSVVNLDGNIPRVYILS